MRRLVSLVTAGLVCAMLSAPALGDTVRINGTNYTVTPTEAAQMALDAAKRQDDAAAPATTTIQQVSSYAELGRTIGASLAASAREMGVAVNDFANTPIGMIATWLIVYRLIGHDIIHFIVGGLWLIVALPTWFYLYRRTAIIKDVSFTFDEKNRRRKTVSYYNSAREDVTGAHIGFMLIGTLITAAGLLIIFS